MAPPDRSAKFQALAESGVFDAGWYLGRNDDVASAGGDALEHFVDYGWDEERWPNRYFDPRWYRLNNPDVAEAGADPLLHYLRDGEREGRRPHPRFDPVWYRDAYRLQPARSALGDFIARCRTGTVVPSAPFFPVPLIQPYRADVGLGRDPIAHYLDDCESAGVVPFPDLDVVRASLLVDDNYYLINAADVQDAEADPIEHYCRYGWHENRKPNLYFEPAWYAGTNPVVSRLGINPLVHYILLGEAANRRPVPYFDPGWYRSQYTVPAGMTALAHYLAHRRSQLFSPTPLFDVKAYVARFAAELGPNRDPFVHYLYVGSIRDVDPNASFDAAHYRRAHLGRAEQDTCRPPMPARYNPLVHYLNSTYPPAEPDPMASDPPREAIALD